MMLLCDVNKTNLKYMKKLLQSWGNGKRENS